MKRYFNYNEFKSGKVAKTENGAIVKFVCESRGKMVVSVKPRFALAYTDKYNVDGRKYRTDGMFDLYMEMPRQPRDAKGRFMKRS